MNEKARGILIAVIASTVFLPCSYLLLMCWAFAMPEPGPNDEYRKIQFMFRESIVWVILAGWLLSFSAILFGIHWSITRSPSSRG